MRDFVLSDDPVVPMLHPRLLVQLAVECSGCSEADVLSGTGIPVAALSSPEARISQAQFGLLIDNAVQLTDDPGLGSVFGRRVQLQNLGMLGLLVMSCPTVRHALEAAVQYQGVFSPVLDMSLSIEDRWAVIRCRPAMHLGRHLRFAVEALLGILDGNGQTLLGFEFEVEEVRVPYARPAHFPRYNADHVRNFVFEADEILIRIEAKLLEHSLGGDPITAELARRQCASQLGPCSRGLLGQIQDHLDASPGKYSSMEKVARDLRTSPRSLRRYLRAMSTSYQALVDEARRRHAEQAVRNTTLTIQQVAELVGYEDVRGFRRAWVRWTGQTPSEYRQALGNESLGMAS